MRLYLSLVLPVILMFQNLAHADTPANVLDAAPSHFAKSGDLKVHYKSLGEGKTALVFIHGWCGDLNLWFEQATAFKGKLRMIFIDLPGYGKSDKPKIDYTMDVFAKGVDAVLQDAGVEKAVLAVHSMGTPVVRQFFRLFPEKTKGLIFVDGPLKSFITDPAQLEQFLALFKEETFKEDGPKFFGRMVTKNTPTAVREQIQTTAAGANPQVAVSSMRNMMNAKNWKDDPITVPAQAIMAKSPNWSDEYKAYAKKLVPSLDFREFDGVGHFLFMEKPKEINAALAEFLTKQGMLK